MLPRCCTHASFDRATEIVHVDATLHPVILFPNLIFFSSFWLGCLPLVTVIGKLNAEAKRTTQLQSNACPLGVECQAT